MYVAIGIFGYFTWYEYTISDVLLMYSKTSSENMWIFACRLFVNMTVLFSIPMILFFGRAGFFSMIKKSSESPEPTDYMLYAYNVVFLTVIYLATAFLVGFGGGKLLKNWKFSKKNCWKIFDNFFQPLPLIRQPRRHPLPRRPHLPYSRLHHAATNLVLHLQRGTLRL